MSTVAAKLETVIVTKAELEEIAEWERKYAKAKKDQAAAEKEVKFRRLALAEKVLGVKTEDDLKQLTPAQVQNRFTKRLESGDWELGYRAPEFSFKKTHEGRYPSWQELFIEQTSETAAARIKAETPMAYSYAVEVSTL